MRAFLASVAAAIIIAVVAGFVLSNLGRGSAEVYSTPNVRL